LLRPARWPVMTAVLVLPAVLAAMVVAVFVAPLGRPAEAAGEPVLVGAGDIATCGESGDEVTADLLDGIPGTVFTTGEHGNETRMRAVWSTLYRANADVVVNGHDHDYERFAPQNPGGKLDRSRGIREFVVGTSGRELRPFDGVRPNSRARSAETLGVLKLTLGAHAYDWRFAPVAGETFTDSGTGRCY
jgi:hypothetical protein